MEQLYTNQLRKVLQGFTNSYSDREFLYGAKFQIEVKSKESKYKRITIREIQERLRQLSS